MDMLESEFLPSEDEPMKPEEDKESSSESLESLSEIFFLWNRFGFSPPILVSTNFCWRLVVNLIFILAF